MRFTPQQLSSGESVISGVTLARSCALRDTSIVRWKMKHVTRPLAVAAFLAAQLEAGE